VFSYSLRFIFDIYNNFLVCVGSPSGVFKLLTTGQLSASFHEHPARRGFPGFPDLQSALPPLESVYTLATGAEPPITTKTATFAGCCLFACLLVFFLFFCLFVGVVFVVWLCLFFFPLVLSTKLSF